MQDIRHTFYHTIRNLWQYKWLICSTSNLTQRSRLFRYYKSFRDVLLAGDDSKEIQASREVTYLNLPVKEIILTLFFKSLDYFSICIEYADFKSVRSAS